MASMSLEFILCKPERASPPRTRSQSKTNAEGLSAVVQARQENIPSAHTNDQTAVAKPAARRNNGKCRSKEPTEATRQEHVRQLQNLRQRRYRERKKSIASALETNAEQLHLENGALETSILEHFKSQS